MFHRHQTLLSRKAAFPRYSTTRSGRRALLTTTDSPRIIIDIMGHLLGEPTLYKLNLIAMVTLVGVAIGCCWRGYNLASSSKLIEGAVFIFIGLAAWVGVIKLFTALRLNGRRRSRM